MNKCDGSKNGIFIDNGLGVSNSETTDQAKDGGKKSFEVPSAQEKVKETKEPKARGEEDLQSQG
jgi:hypothetical protein